MKLAQKDLKQFLKLHKSLLLYTNQRLKLNRDATTINQLLNLGIKELMKVRDALYSQPSLIDDFIAENPSRLNSEELKAVSEWRNHVKGTFYILRYLKKYAIFLDEQSPAHAYGVLALSETLDEILGPGLPVRLEAVLLPFKDQIVYDGFVTPYNVIFGKGIRDDLNEEYREAKHRFGVVTSLPWTGDEKKSDAELLKFYLKNNGTRLRYEEEIEELVNKDPANMKLYYRQMGEVHSRKIRKQLHGLGANDAWFAVIEGIVIASGASKEQVTSVLKHILPEDKREFTYIFHFKKKG
ncbi:hypothetical protein A3K81_04165 [Candidatus Bathyarchaeota archaeon RBG_13_60_20]|nr:MAG: hypothetical protein A3K81_04165 [Candidatus Bathyarchaeota archaeon RBG_13_60_20]